MSSDNPWAMPEGLLAVEDEANEALDEALGAALSYDDAMSDILSVLDRLNPDQAVSTLGRMVAFMLLHLAPSNQPELLADAFCHALHRAIFEQKNKGNS